MVLTDYTELLFNHTPYSIAGNVITVKPNFRCPMHGSWSETPFNITIPVNRNLDVNRLQTFNLPCGDRVLLYLGVHKTRAVNDLRICIQKSSGEGADGLPADWWSVFPH